MRAKVRAELLTSLMEGLVYAELERSMTARSWNSSGCLDADGTAQTQLNTGPSA